MATYFECRVRYVKTLDNGAVKQVNEPFFVDALSFAEAEERVTGEVSPLISGDFTVTAAKKTRIAEIFWDRTNTADRFYLVKANFLTLDERGREKKTANHILVQASDIRDALKRFEEGMKGTMADYKIAAIGETPIADVFKYEAAEEDTTKPDNQ